jgi:hypothetical protein
MARFNTNVDRNYFYLLTAVLIHKRTAVAVSVDRLARLPASRVPTSSASTTTPTRFAIRLNCILFYFIFARL